MEVSITKKDLLEVVGAFATVAIACSIILATYLAIYPSQAPEFLAVLFARPQNTRREAPTFKVVSDSNPFSLHSKN